MEVEDDRRQFERPLSGMNTVGTSVSDSSFDYSLIHHIVIEVYICDLFSIFLHFSELRHFL